VEIALYNLYSVLSEMELGAVYKMSKANDIYSGLGQQDKLLEPKAADAEGSEVVEEVKKDLVTALAEECEEAEREREEKEQAEKAAAEVTEGEKQDSDVSPPPPPTAAEEAAATAAAAETKPAAAVGTVSGVAQQLAALEKRKKREAALVRAIQRAETIAESYEGIKVRLIVVCNHALLPGAVPTCCICATILR
jgi:hypothetical protein